MINIERFNGFFALGVLALCLSMLGSTSDPSVLGTDGAVRAAPNGEDAPLAEPLACQFEIRARNTLERDVWVLFPKSKVKRPNRIGAQTRYLEGGMQDQRIRPGERMNERYEAKGGCGALRRWTFMVRIGPSGRSPILYLLATTYDETDRRIDLGESACWLESIRDGELEVAAGRYGCEAERTSARQPLEGADNTNTTEEATDQSEGSVDVHLDGTWLRRDSNNPRNNGMRISVRGDRATLTAMPPTGSQRFRTGQVLWQDLANDGTVRVRGSDGGYYPAHVKMEGPDRLHIDIDHNGPGNDQTWERAGPSIDGDWVLVEATDGENEGLRVRVDGSQATARFVPSTASRSFRVGARAWRDIGSGDQPQLGKLEALSDGREYGTAQFRLLDENRLRVVFDAGGTVQLWARPGVAEELRAARERDESLAEGPQPQDPVGDPLARGGDLEQPDDLPELDMPEDPTPPAPEAEEPVCLATSLRHDALDVGWGWGLTAPNPSTVLPVSALVHWPRAEREEYEIAVALPRFEGVSQNDGMIVDADRSFVADLDEHASFVWRTNDDGRQWRHEPNLVADDLASRIASYRDDDFRFRPIDIEGYTSPDGNRYTAVWMRNREGVEWQAEFDLTSSEYGSLYRERRETGYRLADVEAYATPGGVRFAGIWYKSCDDTNWRQYRNLTRQAYQERLEELQNSGFRVIDFESYRTPSGQRIAAIWEKVPSRAWRVRTNRTLKQFMNYHRRYVDEGFRLIDYESNETSDGIRYGGIWAENSRRYRYAAREAIDDSISTYRQTNDLKGLSVVIVQDGDVVYRRGFGWADSAAGKWAHAETVYLTASISKAIGATLAAKMEEDGVGGLDLTDNTSEYLTRAVDYLVDEDLSATCQIAPSSWLCRALPGHHTHTVEQLMAKSGCVQHYPEGPEPDGSKFYRWRAQALNQIWDTPLLANCVPGQHYRYSTHSFTYVGAVLEAVSRTDIATLVRNELSRPYELLSMRAMFTGDGRHGLPSRYHRASPYKLTNRSRLPHPRNNPTIPATYENTSWKVLGGGIEIHAIDLADFGWKLLDGQIVSGSTRDARLWTSLTNGSWNTVAPSTVSGGTVPSSGGVGMAWELGGSAGSGNGRWVRHGGDGLGAGTYMKIWRDRDLVIAMLSNRRDHDNRSRNSFLNALAGVVLATTPP